MEWIVDVDASARGSGAHTAGSGLVDSARATWEAAGSEDWGEFAASGGVLALDAMVTAIDPIGAALAAGVGWLIEHFGPLRELLDFFAGDPNAIAAGVETWNSVKEELQALAKEFPGTAEQQTSDWSGQAKDAYSKQIQTYADGLESLSISAGTASSTLATAGTMVATCRAIIRDIVAAIVAELIKGALAALAGSVVSFGATVAGYLAYAAGRIGMTVAKITAKISSLLAKLGKAGAHLAKVLDDMAKVSAKVGADLVTSGAKTVPANSTVGGATTAAGQAAAKASDGAASASSGAAKVSEGLVSSSESVADAARGLGRGSEQLAGSGLNRIVGAEDAGRAVAEGAGKRAQDWVQRTGLFNGADGAQGAARMDHVSNVVNPESVAARAALGANQYHEQNYDDTSGDNASTYDGYNRHGQYTGEHGTDGWYDGTYRMEGTLPDPN
ncbi:hypothetical protein GIY23_16445 [Allosaccharopolyspora coralli]|uniref:PPE domain-containing protein n=1 Tax=Allosaccharopolyspora coralli TaxID=2665642 RepID=A0A5Q3Q8U3_9PSEU|nr:hypothetical protein [Allosaccharopolyspora coralli]QGK70892.1 hypothetical protein GIY23_16445 [Allosaccharopolyspora coralli]